MSRIPLWLIKVVLFIVCLIPLGWLVYGALNQQLGANPVEYITHFTGDWSLRFLLITLAVTPLRRLTGLTMLVRLRRMLGLFAFFYVSLHLVHYAVLDLGMDWSHLGEDIIKRPFITVGFAAWVLLVPLAVTSNRRMIKRLGSRWKSLHRLVYLIAFAGIVHFLWLVKKDLTEPLIYLAIFILLMLLRLPRLHWPGRQQATADQ